MKIVPLAAVRRPDRTADRPHVLRAQPRQGQHSGGRPDDRRDRRPRPGSPGSRRGPLADAAGSDPAERARPSAARPRRAEPTARISLLDRIVEDVDGPVVLVAHSAGVLVVVHWAATYVGTSVVGALLATPPAFAAELPPEYPSIDRAPRPRLATHPAPPAAVPEHPRHEHRRRTGQPGAAAGPGERVGEPGALARRRRPPEPGLRVRRLARGARADPGAGGRRVAFPARPWRP